MSSTVSLPAFGMYTGAATGTPFVAPSLNIGTGDIARGERTIGSGDRERIGIREGGVWMDGADGTGCAGGRSPSFLVMKVTPGSRDYIKKEKQWKP